MGILYAMLHCKPLLQDPMAVMDIKAGLRCGCCCRRRAAPTHNAVHCHRGAGPLHDAGCGCAASEGPAEAARNAAALGQWS